MVAESKILKNAADRAYGMFIPEFMIAGGSFVEAIAVGQDSVPLWGHGVAGLLAIFFGMRFIGNLKKGSDIEGYIEKEKRVAKEPMLKRAGRFALGRPLNLTVRI